MGYLCSAIKWVIGLVILSGVVVFLLWFFNHKSSPDLRADIDDAALTRFDLDGSGTLRYNLTLSVSLRNADGGTVHYRQLEASALYDGREFGATNLTHSKQDAKTSDTLRPGFHGQAAMPGGSVAARYDEENGKGVYGIDVKLVGDVKIDWTSVGDGGSTLYHEKKYTLRIDCGLMVPLFTGGNATAGFNTTACNVTT